MSDPSLLTALKSAEFWLLLVAAMCAGFGVSGTITIPATMAGLLMSSLPKYGPLYPRANAVGADAAFWATVLASILIAAAASIAAHVLGRLTWWFWSL